LNENDYKTSQVGVNTFQMQGKGSAPSSDGGAKGKRLNKKLFVFSEKDVPMAEFSLDA